MCQELLSQCDAVFSMHGATSTGALSPWVEFLDVAGPVGVASFAMARASGFRDLMALNERPGRLLRALGELGVPVIEGEVGGRGRTCDENVAYYLSRVASVARHLGVMAGDDGPVGDAPQRSIWRLGPTIEAEEGGLFTCEVALRKRVQRGDRLGTIVDAFGEEVSCATSPVDGLVGGYRDHSGVRAGDALVTLWTPTGPLAVAEW